MITVKGCKEHQNLIREYFQDFLNVWNCDCNTYYYVVIQGKVIMLPEYRLPKGTKIITCKELLEL